MAGSKAHWTFVWPLVIASVGAQVHGQAILEQLIAAPDEASLIDVHQQTNVPRGDVDGNRIVEFRDFLQLAAHYGQTDASYENADLNLDGRVDIGDYAILSQNFERSEYMPEPSVVASAGNLGVSRSNADEVIISTSSPVAVGAIEIVSPSGTLTPADDGTQPPGEFKLRLASQLDLIAWAAIPAQSISLDGDLMTSVRAATNDVTVRWFEPGSYEVYTRSFGVGDAVTGRPIVNPDPPVIVDPVDPDPPDNQFPVTEAIVQLNEARDLATLDNLHRQLDIPRGDLSGNGSVEFVDFLTIAQRFGEPASSYGDGDLTLDGFVDIEDIAILSTNFGGRGYSPDPPSVDRADLTASVLPTGEVVIGSESPVELGGIELSLADGSFITDGNDARPFTFFLQKQDEIVVLANLGKPMMLDGDLVTDVSIENPIDLSLRWFQSGSYEVFTAPRASIIVVDPVFDPFQADIDGDGVVAFSDFLILRQNYGQSMATASQGDLDGDGEVAFLDYLILSRSFGNVAAIASVPEPMSGGLLFVGVAAMLVCRRPSQGRPKRTKCGVE